MALASGTLFEINSGATASNVNAGGFNPANANMLTDLACDSSTGNTNSPVVSSASYNFVAGDVGHWVYIKSGSNWTPGFYKIASVASNKATLMAAVGEAEQLYLTRSYRANTVAGCGTVGTPTSGTWTIDYSRSTSSPFASTDLASTTGTTNPSTITSAANPFGLQMVGNLIRITAGTSWTQGWYEIVSVSGVTATLDRAVGSAATLSSGTGRVGGALSLGASSDDSVFELAGTSSQFYIKGNATYTLGGAISISASSSATLPVLVEGYNSMRGDRPTGSTRPTIACGSNACNFGVDREIRNLIFTGTGSPVCTLANGVRAYHCKSINSSTTAGRSAFSGAPDSAAFFCEAISYRGNGFTIGDSTIHFGCYVHASNNGFTGGSGAGGFAISNCIISSNVTNGITITSSQGIHGGLIINNTFYGAENKQGVGLDLVTGSGGNYVFNNIFYGFETGIKHADTQYRGYGDYNNFYNNTNDVSAAGQWQKGLNDIALDPQFTSVSQLTGSTATTSGSVLTQSGGDFSSVVDGRDFVRIVSGTGVTAGIYGITAHTSTTLTLDIAPGTNATADKVWEITIGGNFGVGTNMKAVGFPGEFPAGLSTGYMDIGAVQRQEAGGGGLITHPGMSGGVRG